MSLDQLKVMSAIERCRTAALGGHVARCENDACASHRHRLQQLSQPALPEVPGSGGTQVAGRARGRAAARRLLPCRLHVAGRVARHGLSEQARDLPSAHEGVGRDHAHDRRRSQAPGRQDRHHRRAPHLGLGADASSARAHDRAGRRAVGRWRAMGLSRAGLPRARQRARRACSGAVAGDAGQGARAKAA